jgi:TrmH family RNA methyltransferase
VIDVISPCVTFNDHPGSTKSYSYMKDHEEPLHDSTSCPIRTEEISGGDRMIGGRDPRSDTARRLAAAAAEAAAANPIALVFGSEKFGLGNEDCSYCHCLLRIPTREEHGSMNLGQAVALCLYELIRDPEAPVLTPTAARRAEAADLHRLTERMLEVLRRSGYINPRTESIEDKIRRLVWRLDLSAQDVEVWLGIFRQVQWKLDREASRQ